MIPDDNFNKLYLARRLCEPAKKYIEAVRKAPWREPAGRGSAVVGVYQSAKSGLGIRFGNHKTELPLIVQMESKPDVLVYFDGLEPIKITYDTIDSKGRVKEKTLLYNPTFLKITRDAIVFVECRSKSELNRRYEQYPGLYIKTEENETVMWRCPGGERAAEKWGWKYEVWSSGQLNWEWQTNLVYLDRYYSSETPLVPDETIAALAVSTVERDPGITLRALLDGIEAEIGKEAKPGEIVQTFNILIVQQRLYVNLEKDLLTEPDETHVFTSIEVAKSYHHLRKPPPWDLLPTPRTIRIAAGVRVVWGTHNWVIADFDEEQVELLKENKDPAADDDSLVSLPLRQFYLLMDRGIITGLAVDVGRFAGLNELGREIMLLASAKDKAIANKKMDLIDCYLNHYTLPKLSESEARARRRAWQDYKQGIVEYGNGYVGLVTRYWNCGPKGPKLSQRTRNLLLEAAKQYEVPDRPTKVFVYKAFVKACEAEGTAECSYVYFCDYLRKRPYHQQQVARRGTRGAYESAPQYTELEYETPRHGAWPMHIAHIDHTLADIELRSSDGTVKMGRAWVSLMICTFTRRILAVYVTYDKPSYRSCMMLLRECVRRFHRLPNTIVVDRGSDFQSNYFDTFLSLFRIHKLVRPTAMPRFGSVLERLFLTVNLQFFWNLKGNTQNTKNVRELTRETDPKERSVWKLWPLYCALQDWAYNEYDQKYHDTLGMSPREAFRQGLRLTGTREHEAIAYDIDFIRESMPSTSIGFAKVTDDGVKINNIFYWDEMMRTPGVLYSTVQVRYDPLNAGIAYIRLRPNPESSGDPESRKNLGMWVECKSHHYPRLRGRSEKEIQEATAKIREKNRARNIHFKFSLRQLSEYIVSPEAAQDLATQRLRDAEAKPIWQSIVGNISGYSLDASGGLTSPAANLRSVGTTVEQDFEPNSAPEIARAQATEPPIDKSALPRYGDF
ncbi:MAG TPA: Mu transposase C-terminal domain-containing protein [Chloroflexia bacterium]|jgi:transposase InsO family protein